MPPDQTPEPPLFLDLADTGTDESHRRLARRRRSRPACRCALACTFYSEHARAIVEVGSYCGRSTVVLGSVVQSLRLDDARVYAIDPHDGKLGALDQGVEQLPPSLDKFHRNIALPA